MSTWVEPVCSLAKTWRTGNASIRQLFEPARSHLDDREEFVAAVTGWLRAHPDLVEAWQGYCDDKRTARGPYLDVRIPQVGFYDSGDHDATDHTDVVDACADFIYREA